MRLQLALSPSEGKPERKSESAVFEMSEEELNELIKDLEQLQQVGSWLGTFDYKCMSVHLLITAYPVWYRTARSSRSFIYPGCRNSSCRIAEHRPCSARASCM